MQLTCPMLAVVVLITTHMQEPRLSQIIKIFVTILLVMNIDFMIGGFQSELVKDNLRSINKTGGLVIKKDNNTTMMVLDRMY